MKNGPARVARRSASRSSPRRTRAMIRAGRATPAAAQRRSPRGRRQRACRTTPTRLRHRPRPSASAQGWRVVRRRRCAPPRRAPRGPLRAKCRNLRRCTQSSVEEGSAARRRRQTWSSSSHRPLRIRRSSLPRAAADSQQLAAQLEGRVPPRSPPHQHATPSPRRSSTCDCALLAPRSSPPRAPHALWRPLPRQHAALQQQLAPHSSPPRPSRIVG